MKKGFCVWFTGYSASGKSTLAKLLEKNLLEKGIPVEILDGDIIRNNLSKGLGFTRTDRETNLRRIAFVAKLLARNGVAVIVAAISPYENIRKEVRSEIEGFVEVFLDCPIEVCIARDPKGLYRKALKGEIENFTGISDPFELPENPEVVVKTHQESPEQSIDLIVRSLELFGHLQSDYLDGYSDEERSIVEKRLKDLGYI